MNTTHPLPNATEATTCIPSTHLSSNATPYMPEMIICQQDGCPQRHHTRFLNGFGDCAEQVEVDGTEEIAPGITQLKRCKQCKQVHYCSVECQRKDWRKRHRVECQNFGKVPAPNVNISSANTAELKAVLIHIFQSCITSGEERNWGPGGTNRVGDVGRRLYVIGGKDLCVSVCDGLRNYFKNDKRRSGDARMLEYAWMDPVVPEWWP